MQLRSDSNFIFESLIQPNRRHQFATRLLKDFVKRTRTVSEENEQGEMVEISRVHYAEDDLDMLKTYPLEHPRPLPSDPFCGPVTAAINSLHQNRRRQKNTLDIRFNPAHAKRFAFNQ